MRALDSMLKLKGLNEAQIKTVCGYLDTVPKDKYKETLDRLTTLTYDEVIDQIITPINWAKLNRNVDHATAEGKYLVMHVVGEPEYSYSIGIPKALGRDHELVILYGLSDKVASSIIGEVVQRYKDGTYPNETIELNTCAINVNGQMQFLRVKVIECDNTTHMIDMLLPNIETIADTPQRIFQIQIADGDNILPTEDGYSLNNPQTVEYYTQR